ncbi:MAG TPA: diguanylate cyclase [Solirubrobacterales bacterium]|jgi:diguanylate cyclase (GGDEF)-like protein|nr:diguanylate cyclase [Solirubrobacterales bacterium]
MRVRFWLGMVAVAAIAIGSIIGALVVSSNEHDAFERRQREEALRSAHQVEALARLSVGQLSSAAAFYQAEGNFSRHEFEVVADSLLGTGALSATGFIESVPNSGRQRYEHRRGLPILDRNALGALRPEGRRRQYFPLTFAAANGLSIQPPDGYDVGSDPLRHPYLLRARDSGRPVASRVIRLPAGGTGINVFRPVYRDGAPTATVAQRRGALLGFAVGGFHIPDLTSAADVSLPGGSDVELVEGGRPVAGPDLSGADTASAPIRIADRRWLLAVSDPNGPGVGLPVLMVVFGLSLAALLGALVLIWNRNERMQELKRQAGQDSLTGLKNRRRFEEDLRAELARSRRYGVAGALLMLDLDHFKRVNDTLGHPAGDRVIAEIAAVLRTRTRETDVLARLGGDEFAIVLPRCDLAEAEAVAEEIATAVREHMYGEEGIPPITACIGIAPFGPKTLMNPESVLAKADAAMYAAKGSGRDAVRTFDFIEADVASAEVSPGAGEPI